jgi:hypothetical protein
LTIEPLQMRNQTSPKLEEKMEDNGDKILFSIESSNPTTSSLKFSETTKSKSSSKMSLNNYDDNDSDSESMSDDDDDDDDSIISK